MEDSVASAELRGPVPSAEIMDDSVMKSEIG